MHHYLSTCNFTFISFAFEADSYFVLAVYKHLRCVKQVLKNKTEKKKSEPKVCFGQVLNTDFKRQFCDRLKENK